MNEELIKKIDSRIQSIIRNLFIRALNQSTSSLSAFEKVPDSPKWIQDNFRSFEANFKIAIDQTIEKIIEEMSIDIRVEYPNFWEKVNQFLFESFFQSINQFRAETEKECILLGSFAFRYSSEEVKRCSGRIETFISNATGNQFQSDSFKNHHAFQSPSKADEKSFEAKKSTHYVDPERILQLSEITDFDPQKLIQLCKEINIGYENECFLSVGTLLRSLLDHVPPLFEKSNFIEVANSYKGTKSFKHSMQNLENSSRNIADAILHTQIRKKETLPNRIQINFSADLDVLLAEIIRIRK